MELKVECHIDYYTMIKEWFNKKLDHKLENFNFIEIVYSHKEKTPTTTKIIKIGVFQIIRGSAKELYSFDYRYKYIHNNQHTTINAKLLSEEWV